MIKNKNVLKKQTLIFGLGNNVKNRFIKENGINKRIHIGFLKTRHYHALNKIIRTVYSGESLKEKLKKNLLFLKRIKIYRSIINKKNSFIKKK